MAKILEFTAETGSTSGDLIARLANGEQLADGHWLIADRQLAGHGRRGRAWLDAPGNFMGSSVVRLYPHDQPAATLSFVAALAVYEVIVPRLADPAALMLKWPNDLLLRRAKLAGILLEREGEHAVIGIGVNLATAPNVAGRDVGTMAAGGPAPARDAFAADLARQMAIEIGRWREFGFAPFRRRWLAAAHAEGTELSVFDGSGAPLLGKFCGLEDDGALRLGLADGSIRAIRAGDVFLKDD